MAEWLAVVVLGVIEGVTEFLPVSSTGHLLLVDRWLAVRQSDTFLVVIQGGAVAAVLLIFKARVRQLVAARHDAAGRDYLVKLSAAFGLTAAGGLLLEAVDFALPETATPVAVALLAGGVLFVVVERALRRRAGLTTIGWPVAVAMGGAQLVAAVFPGTSRSGAAILIALVMGLDRQLAIEFSFLLGVPTLLAAGALKLVTHPAGQLSWTMLALGSAVSAVTAFAAVWWLMRYVQAHTFEGFGWYRIVLGILVLWSVLGA